MADDAVTVLDAVGVERAHVYGLSLGGMVAQALALRHPDRVRSLVLGATSPGGPRVVRRRPRSRAFFRRRLACAPEEAAWASVPINYGPRCRAEHAERIEEDLARRLAHPFSERAYRAQLFAAAMAQLPRRAAAHRACRRSSSTARWTGSSRWPTRSLIADGIPGAQLRVLDGGRSPVPDRGAGGRPARSRGSSPTRERRPHDARCAGLPLGDALRVADVIRHWAAERAARPSRCATATAR